MSKSISIQVLVQQLPSQPIVRKEAERRAKFVRGMGGSVSGYCDGYADGFEHAVAWLLSQDLNPLKAEYRPSSGMTQAKNYYQNYPKERKRILEWFEKIGAEPEIAAKSQMLLR